MTIFRTYSELSRFTTFEDRFDYLQLKGSVGTSTFGFDRYLNQRFYTSREWKQARDYVIGRDLGLDLGIDGYEIYDKVIIHHINPITAEQIEMGDNCILDPENLITTTHNTHNAIHYGDKSLLMLPVKDREFGDTKLW